MIQRVDQRRDVAQEIAARIAASVQPWRIVLFGSRARGTASHDSDYDIYVEVDADRAQLRDRYCAIRDALRMSVSIDIKVARRGDLERRRDDPGTIEWDVAREGRVLYAHPSAETRVAPPDRIREPSPDPPESVHEWLATAERDERHCRRLRDSEDPVEDWSPEICWLSQQVAEKYLKALLVSRRVRPERTHDLAALLVAARLAGCELQGLDADCELLTKQAIEPRYPAGLDRGEDDARAAFDAMRRVRSAVRAYVAPTVH